MPSLILTALLAVTATVGGKVQVTTLDGQVAEGSLSAWSNRDLTVVTESGETAFSAAELLKGSFSSEFNAPADALHIELIDGTRLAYSSVSVSGGNAIVSTLDAKRPLKLPREAIRLIEFRPMTPLIAAALEQIASKDIPEDAIVVSQGESESMDYLTGVIGDVSADQVMFEWDGDRVPVKRTKIAAMVFYQAPKEPGPEPLCELALSNGSQIVVSQISLQEDRLQVTVPSGAKLDLELSDVVSADFSGGKIVYLSDMKPTVVAWTPGLGVPDGEAIAARNLPRSDTSFAGEPLSLVWNHDANPSRREMRTYSKGLAIRSRTELTYRLPSGMTRFLATTGIDPRDAGQGHVVLTIRGDERVLWEGVIDGRKPPVEIDVQLNAARRLHLTVDYGDSLDYGDRLHLIEARVTK